MTWTYTSDPANVPRDAVRLLVGDTDTDDQKLQDGEIAYFLSQGGNDTYLAAALSARAIAASYAALVDTKFEGVSSDYSQIRDNYYALATKLEAQSKKYGSRGLGVPVAGGISRSDIDAADEDTDRVQPKFKQDQFANPPRNYDGDQYGY